jgi:hypothetical protein
LLTLWQVTTTLFIAESGDVLPAQIIWAGSTDRCHPKDCGPAPDGIIWDHTESHWQTPASFKRLIMKIIVPYKDAKIVELGLDPLTQMTLLKVDMHYSHHKEDMAEFLKGYNIILLFVPGGCTDILQECDVCLNFVFKVAIRTSFRDHLHHLFIDWCVENPEHPERFHPSMASSKLKPHLSNWVHLAMQQLKTPSMRATIQRCFAKDGCFTEMRKRAADLTVAADVVRLDVAQMLIDMVRQDMRSATQQDEAELDRLVDELVMQEGIEEDVVEE